MRRNPMINDRLRDYSAAFAFALAANTFFYLSFQSTFPVLPRYIADVVLNQPPEAVARPVGLATTVLALVAVITRIPAGQLSDRFGHRRFMLFGAICFVLAPLIYAASQNMPLLLLGRVVQGVGLATFTTAYVALATELAPEGRRGEALGLAGASMSVAFIIAPLIGDWVAVNWGYAQMFKASAVVAAVSVVLVPLTALHSGTRSDHLTRAKMRSPGALQASESRELAELTNTARLRLALAQTGVRAGVLTMAVLGIPFGAFITFLPLFAKERNIAGVGVVFSVYAAMLFFSQPLAGSITDRLGRRSTIIPGLVITGLGVGLLALDGSLFVFALAGGVFGLGGGLVRGGVDPLVQDSVPPSLRGTAAAAQYTSFDFWIGVGSYPIGLLANVIGYVSTFVVTGVYTWLGAVGVTVMLRGTRCSEHVYRDDPAAFI